jgi:hypothetical protein
MTTKELTEAAAWLAILAAAGADPDEVEQRPGESDARYVARLVHYGAIVAEGK